MDSVDTSLTSLEGHITVTSVNSKGERTVVFESKNQIVNGFLDSVSRLITQKPTEPPPEDFAINSLWVEASDIAYTQGVTADDNRDNLEGHIIKRYVFDRTSDVDIDVGGIPGLVEFRARIDRQEGNGEIVRGVGLYTAGDDAENPATSGDVRLVARQVIGAIPKHENISLEFTWRIQIQIISDEGL